MPGPDPKGEDTVGMRRGRGPKLDPHTFTEASPPPPALAALLSLPSSPEGLHLFSKIYRAPSRHQP